MITGYKPDARGNQTRLHTSKNNRFRRMLVIRAVKTQPETGDVAGK